MKGEVKGADKLRIDDCIVAQGNEKATTPHHHF